MKAINPKYISSIISKPMRDSGYTLIHKKGDLKKSEIKFLGITFRKAQYFEDNIYNSDVRWEPVSKKHIDTYYYLFIDDEVFLKPKVVITMTNEQGFEKTFDSIEAMDKYLERFKNLNLLKI